MEKPLPSRHVIHVRVNKSAYIYIAYFLSIVRNRFRYFGHLILSSAFSLDIRTSSIANPRPSPRSRSESDRLLFLFSPSPAHVRHQPLRLNTLPPLPELCPRRPCQTHLPNRRGRGTLGAQKRHLPRIRRVTSHEVDWDRSMVFFGVGRVGNIVCLVFRSERRSEGRKGQSVFFSGGGVGRTNVEILGQIEIFDNRVVVLFWNRGRWAAWHGRGKHLSERTGATATWRPWRATGWEADSVAPDASFWGGRRRSREMECAILVWAREGVGRL